MPTDEQNAIWYPTTNFWHNRYGYEANYIIVHGTASSSAVKAQDIAAYFRSTEITSNPVSTHYIVDQTGNIVQCVSESDASWGNGVRNGKFDSWWTVNPNFNTISIEHVNPTLDNSAPLTTAQKQASFQLIKHICQRNKIPMQKADKNGGITGHFSIDPIDRANCPGNYPWNDLFAYLGGTSMIDIGNPVIAQHFVLVGVNRWQCKENGFVIANGMLDHYRNASNDKYAGLTELGLPLNNEHSIIGNDGKIVQNVVEQAFERGILRWDAGHVIENPPGSTSCYTINLGSLYDAASQASVLKNQVATFQSTITEIQKQLDSLQKQRDAAIVEAQTIAQQRDTALAQVQQFEQQKVQLTPQAVLDYLNTTLSVKTN
jgi:N-acetyl-anhydromuramyl-L-alanine amidase AmpD